jgi:CDP-diacylglycerol---glycerol-3-phosphate 3-phosphatidyltransferase
VHRVINLPNILTAYRFAVAPLLLFCLQPEVSPAIALLAFVLFLSAALTDLADGYIARKQQCETILGKLMDPLADKVLVAVALIMLIPMGLVPAWVSFLILARELVITGLRSLAASSGIVVAASQLGKFKSISQYTALSILIFPAGLLPIPYLHDLGSAILYLSLVLTIWSGIEYFYRLQAVFLPDEKEKC